MIPAKRVKSPIYFGEYKVYLVLFAVPLLQQPVPELLNGLARGHIMLDILLNIMLNNKTRSFVFPITS